MAQQQRSFLDLPPEVRNIVYQYALQLRHASCTLTDDHESKSDALASLIWMEGESVTRAKSLGRVPPSLASVCRQVRSESLRIFFWINDWSIFLASDTAVQYRCHRGAATRPAMMAPPSFRLRLSKPAMKLLSPFNKDTPLFRRLRVWGSPLLKHPCLALVVSSSGVPTIDHGHWCPGCNDDYAADMHGAIPGERLQREYEYVHPTGDADGVTHAAIITTTNNNNATTSIDPRPSSPHDPALVLAKAKAAQAATIAAATALTAHDAAMKRLSALLYAGFDDDGSSSSSSSRRAGFSIDDIERVARNVRGEAYHAIAAQVAEMMQLRAVVGRMFEARGVATRAPPGLLWSRLAGL